MVISRNYTVVCTFYRTKMNVNLCMGLMIARRLLNENLVAMFFRIFTWCSNKVEKFTELSFFCFEFKVLWKLLLGLIRRSF